MKEFDYLLQLPGEKREQDWIRERLETLSVREGVILSAAAMKDPPMDMVQAVNCLQSLDEYTVCLDAGSYEALGQAYLRNETNMPEDALPFADLAQMGQYYEDQHPGLFVGNCYVEYPPTASQPVYHGQGSPLPCDDDWSVKLKLASPAVPEGVWLRLPGLDEYGDESSTEEVLALQELGARRWDECSLADARCVLPEAGDLTEQYSDVGDLIHDSIELGVVLAQKGQGMPHFMERYAAALELEGCRNLKLALDISQNLTCYDWVPCASLEDTITQNLVTAGVSEEIIRASGIDLTGYGAHLLGKKGYTLAPDESVYIKRNDKEFHYQFSTPAQPQEEPGMAMQ